MRKKRIQKEEIRKRTKDEIHLKLWIEMNRQTLDRDRDENVVYPFVPLWV